MSSICGIYNRKGENVNPARLEKMMQDLNHWGADDTGHIVHDPVGFGHLMLYNTPESFKEKLPYHDTRSGLIITADARIDNREELLRKLDLTSSPDLSDSQLILESYKLYNKRCLHYLVGAFAFVIWDEKKNELFCARDHVGFKPLYFFIDKRKFLFGTEVKALIRYPGVSATLNEQFIADALATLKTESDQTFYKNIQKLPPAHYMIVNPDSSYRMRYWDLNPDFELNLSSEEEYMEQFTAQLNQAIKCRLRSAYKTGAELSGGIDSSAVTGFASNLSEITTFSHILATEALGKIFPYKDERKFIQKVTDHCNIQEIYLVTGEEKGLLDSLKQGVRLHDGIIQGTLSLFSDALYETANKAEVRTLLSGFGGDELISYQGAGYLKELAYHHQYRKLWRVASNKRSISKRLKALAGNILAARLFQIKKLLGRHPEYKTPEWAHDIYHELFIAPGLFEETKMKRRFYNFKKLPNDPDIRMRQYRRFHYSYFPMRIENCSLAAQSQKIEYRYPLLDKRLLEFYLSLPSEMKTKNGLGRYILRKSMERVVPQEVAWRNDKMGTTLPGVTMRLMKDYSQIRQLIKKAQQINQKHYIDYDKALEMLDLLRYREKNSTRRIIPQAFYSATMLLLYQLEDY